MQCRPKAIAGAGEVMARGGGVEARIDAAEEGGEVLGDDVGDELVVGGCQLGGRGTLGRRGARSGRHAGCFASDGCRTLGRSAFQIVLPVDRGQTGDVRLCVAASIQTASTSTMTSAMP